MTDNSTSPVNTLGQALEQRIMSELDVRPLQQFEQLLDLKNLAGNSTGYVRAFSGDGLEKGTSVSINMMPGARYMNIHLIPDPQLNAPRFLFEGMLMTRGSQLSMDLFPDFDVVAAIDAYMETYAPVAKVYEEARLDERFTLEPSRILHMRAFGSPVFMLVNAVPEEHRPVIEAYGERYFDAWFDIFRNAGKLSAGEASVRRDMRKKIGDTIKRLDPDRHKVVKVYGEETTCLIEAANMY